MRKTISFVTPGYNESANLDELYRRLKAVRDRFPQYDFEHIFIDNCSTDDSHTRLRLIAAADSKFKVIINARNFGHIRSPYHGILQASGDAVIFLSSDLQDPPEMIVDFIEEWQRGTPICLAVKKSSQENGLMFRLRKTYYRMLARLSDSPQIENFTGFGLYDKKVVDQMRNFKDPYPFFRGIVAEIGFKRKDFPFEQPRRQRGITKNNFYTLYDIGMLGIISYSKLPLRLAVFVGTATAVISFLVGLSYLLYKMIFWDSFQVGMAPLVAGVFFVGSIQLIFLGVVGEYIGAIYTQVRDRPLVIEAERINF